MKVIDNKFFKIIGSFGLLGSVFYFLHIIFGRIFYENYNPMTQAISDLTAENSPSKNTATIFSGLYGIFTVIFSTGFFMYFLNRINKIVNIGSLMFCIMTIISFIGYTFFPLSESGYAGTFQDKIHILVTVLVVVFTIISIIIYIIGFMKTKKYKYIGIISLCTLILLIIGAMLINVLPKEYFGIAERMNVYTIIIYTSILSMWMYKYIKGNMNKSTVEEIKDRFDNDVERFSNLDTGQVSTIDAKITLELITEASLQIVSNAENLLDIGCGAGNYTITMLQKNKTLNCTLVDLSKPMLDKAFERISKITKKIKTIQGDIRSVDFEENSFDIILAGAVLHHLRGDLDWETTFTKIYKILKPNGCLMISDLVTQDTEILTQYMWKKYGDYLENTGGKDYRQKVLDYVEKEDSPRSIEYQLNLMKKIGFKSVDVLHKNMCFGAFCGIK